MFAPNQLFDVTYGIRANETSSGTCFTFEYHGRKYLITAKHVLTGNGTFVEVHTNSGFKQVMYNNYYESSNPEVDIVALEIDATCEQLFNFHSSFFEYTSHGLLLGADTYFLGYPYNLANLSMSSSTRRNAIVKKGIVSGPAYGSESRELGFLLDGHNNPGFSGGPCFYLDNISGKNKWLLFGVISSYVAQTETLYDQKGHARMTINENSGIINTHSIDKIILELPIK